LAFSCGWSTYIQNKERKNETKMCNFILVMYSSSWLFQRSCIFILQMYKYWTNVISFAPPSSTNIYKQGLCRRRRHPSLNYHCTTGNAVTAGESSPTPRVSSTSSHLKDSQRVSNTSRSLYMAPNRDAKSNPTLLAWTKINWSVKHWNEEMTTSRLH